MTLIPFDQRAVIARQRLPRLKQLLASCRLCPRQCRSRRIRGEKGECRLDARLMVSSSHLHLGEEPVISGVRGSGTVFFTGCNLACLYCQNYPISQLQAGRYESARQTADRFLELQRLGAHNINLVTPSPQVVGIVEALAIAWAEGLAIPIVYNCGGYEGTEALWALDGLVDIYLSDLKYGEDETGILSGVTDYFSKATGAIREMFRQVGNLELDSDGIATRGLIVRHLVLPNDQSRSGHVLRWLREEIGTGVYISLMSQYYPSHQAGSKPEIARRLTRDEYDRVLAILEESGIKNGWVQPPPLD